MTQSSAKLICFDCDATLSGIEGVDELARLRGPAVLAEIEAMTTAAMDGRIPLEQVFGRRLEIIRPGRAETEAVGRLYIERIEPTARATVAALKAAGWTPVIVSAGYTQAIAPLAEHLGIGRIEAVRLDFDAAGNYSGYDTAHPATRRGGKPEIVAALRRELRPVRTVAVGDGVSDLETKPVVDLFVGFGRYADRAKVREGAHQFIRQLSDLVPLLQ
ncbi:MAG: HAD-IB family phosphatase [Opitutae bacterium]|nr:HAD-IB family phosphatase [Opitutae bacterium]